MSNRIWLGTAVVLAGMAAIALYTQQSPIASPVRLTNSELSRYPDTGYLPWHHQHEPRLSPAGGLQRIPVIDVASQGSPWTDGNQVIRVDYADAVHADEDLLLGPTAARPTSVPEELNSAAEVVSPQNSPSQSTSTATRPAESQPNPTPTAGQAIQPLASPDATESRTPAPPSPDVTKSPPPSDAAMSFDPNVAPHPDEDLLGPQPTNPQSSVPSQQQPPRPDPIEVLPILPRRDPPLQSNSSSPRPGGPQGAVTGPEPFAPVSPVPDPSLPAENFVATPTQTKPPEPSTAAVDPHAAIFAESLYPSARKCRECHEQIYDEWSVSSHAYASISPMFHKFEQTISALSRGTIGYFCTRCHAPVATALSFPRYGSLVDAELLPDSATEGVTCIACHRVREQYGKANGERRIEPGDIHDPVYGSGYGEVLADVIRRKSEFKVKPEPGVEGPGVDIHRQVIHFEQISDSSFCVSCHQVFVAPGIELEVVWEQYRASPACKQGISCQDCHMGSQPGVSAGYDTAPVAVVNGKPVTPDHKHSNHMFYGPGYSIAHPGVFPFSKAAEKWTTESWLKFDWRSGWGTDQFEDALEDGKFSAMFPKEWENADDRYDAREVVDANLKTLAKKKEMRRRLYENSSHVEGPVLQKPPKTGRPLKFHYVVSNISTGHNMPSGSLGAQPQLWLNVALTGPRGEHLWESGYVDSNGDICDLHSLEVAAGRAPRDLQLFNLQTKFLITHVKGTDREMYLPINTDFDQLPFIRPSGFPITVMNHPPFIRMEAHSIPALGSRKAEYTVPARFIQQPGRYRLSVRLRSRAEPIYFMRFCNATPEMERSMNEWMVDVHEHATEFWVQ